MDKALVRKIQSYLSEEPLRLDMSDWGRKTTKTSLRKGPPCGTMGCIAGWAVLLGLPKEELGFNFAKKRFTRDDQIRFHQLMLDAPQLAPKLLDITPEQSEYMFYTSNWPPDFQDAYITAKNAKERVRVVKRLLNHALANDGDV